MENNITNIIQNYIYNSTITEDTSKPLLFNHTDIIEHSININKNINDGNFLKSSSISKEIFSTISISKDKLNNETNKSQTKELNNQLPSELELNYTNNIINSNFANNYINYSLNSSNDSNIVRNNIIDTTALNILTDYINEKDKYINNTSQNQLNILNNTNSKNATNSSRFHRTIKHISNQIVNDIKKIDKKYITGLEIIFPLIILIIIIFCIFYCIKKRRKNKLIEEKNEIEKNGLNFQNSANKAPYNRIENTSGFNVGLNPNNFSMSEIKVQNLKDEIHNIITNKSSGSNSSGKRKRDKRKMGNNNLNISQENNRGIQNEMKEEIKQYVIDEHLNKN